MIYFIQEEGTCHIKIGFTDGEPEKRLRELQTGSPSPLTLLLALPGVMADEKRLHAQFAAARAQGEWFRPIPALLQLMIESKNNGFLPIVLQGQEKVLATWLITLLIEYGPLAFSLRGSCDHGDAIPHAVAHRARRDHAIIGNDGLHRVFDAVETWALTNLSGTEASQVCSALDHRFDGIGDWWA